MPTQPAATELARAVNNKIRELSGNWGDHEYDFVCECHDVRCFRVVRMTGRDYDDMRANKGRGVVVPGHQQASDQIISFATGRLIIQRLAESSPHNPDVES